jgi:hypothetical protein
MLENKPSNVEIHEREGGMKGMIRVVSVSAVLLGAGGALAEEAPLEELDTRTEEQKLEDAAREARGNAELEALAASIASAPALLEEEAEEATEEPELFPANEYTEEQAVELLRTTEPEIFAYLVGPPVQLRGCWYFISTPPDWAGWGPPRFYLAIRRMASQHCEAKTVEHRDYSWTSGGMVATKESKGLAIAQHMKWSRSGSGLVHTYLYSLDPKTMRLKRDGFLGTYMGSTTPQAMYFEGNRLHVDVWRYVAIYPRFLTHDVPPSGVIFP